MELNRSYSAGCGSALRTVRQAQDRADLAGMWPRLASVVAAAVREAATPKPIARTVAVHWNLRACLDLDSTTTNYVRHRRCRPRGRCPARSGDIPAHWPRPVLRGAQCPTGEFSLSSDDARGQPKSDGDLLAAQPCARRAPSRARVGHGGTVRGGGRRARDRQPSCRGGCRPARCPRREAA